MTNSTPLETHDIQGLVFRSYASLPAADYRMFSLTDAALFRAWLLTLLNSKAIGAAQDSAEGLSRNYTIAFTATGLVKLLGFAYTPDNLPREFVEGMLQPHRSRLLGDIGPNAPDSWRWGNEEAADAIDGLLISYAGDGDAARELGSGAVSKENGMRRRYDVVGEISKQPVEPFGFRDGISQPVIRGTDRDTRLRAQSAAESRIQTVEAGEFVLGYPDGSGSLPRSLDISASADPKGSLKASQNPRRELRDFGRNGTFLVVRQLSQDVDAFEKFTLSAAAGTNFSPADIAAKMVGRYQNGDPLTLGATPSDNNDFDYAADPHGFGCPIGAHIRRANPRASVPAASHEEALAVVNRHRILRRGRGYEEAGGEVGLIFVSVNASISRQFEFVQSAWCNNAAFGGLGGETDPLAGPIDNPQSGLPANDRFTIPGQPFGRLLTGLQPWVRVRGGGYFFMPGLTALRVVASL